MTKAPTYFETTTTIRLSKNLNKNLDEKKEYLGFKSKDDLISHLLGLVKTPQELILEDLKNLKEHLSELGGDEVYITVEELLKDFVEDPKFVLLKERILERYKKYGNGFDILTYKSICRDLDIPRDKWTEYQNRIQLEGIKKYVGD